MEKSTFWCTKFSRNKILKKGFTEKLKFAENFAQPIKDVDEFISSLEELWRNLLHHFLTIGSSAENGCRQNETPNSW